MKPIAEMSDKEILHEWLVLLTKAEREKGLEFEAEILRRMAAGRWVSVKERVPELTEKDWIGNSERRIYFLLLSQPNDVLEGHAGMNMNVLVFWQHGGNGHLVDEVSYWMPRPLPAPPSEGTD